MIRPRAAARCALLAASLLPACALPHEVIFPAPRVIKFPLLPGAQLVRGGEGDDAFLALHRPAPAGHPTLVWLHGNGQQLGDLTPLLHALAADRMGIYAVEYPSYGLLEGAPSEARVTQSVDRALRHLATALGVPPSSQVLIGQSIGSGVAVEMARRGHGGRLALLSPFTSLDQVADGYAGRLAIWMLPDHFDNEAKAPQVTMPVLIVHGTRDRVIPSWMAERLEQRFPQAALFWLVGAGHNDLFSSRYAPQLLPLLRRFAELPLDAEPARHAQK